MGLFKKIKDIFYDEEIVEVPVKEKEKKEEPVKPIIQEITQVEPIRTFKEPEAEKKIENFSERELFKPEKTFDFPVFEEEPIKTRSKTNVLELQRELEQRTISKSNETNTLERTEKKENSFKPSPVISPIYGILDKNYKKEEVVVKKDTQKQYKGEMNYDYVRRKAYGTLEEELEDTLTRVNSEIVESVNELEREIDDLPKPSNNIEELLGEIEKNASVSIGELEEKAKNKMMEEDEEEPVKEVTEEKPEEVDDNTLEHDLFNLIDSMYEDKEE